MWRDRLWRCALCYLIINTYCRVFASGIKSYRSCMYRTCVACVRRDVCISGTHETPAQYAENLRSRSRTEYMAHSLTSHTHTHVWCACYVRNNHNNMLCASTHAHLWLSSKRNLNIQSTRIHCIAHHMCMARFTACAGFYLYTLNIHLKHCAARILLMIDSQIAAS